MTLKELLARENLKHDNKIGDEIALEIALINEDGFCHYEAYIEDCGCICGDIEDVETLYDCEVIRHYYEDDYYYATGESDPDDEDYIEKRALIIYAKKEKEND